VTHTRVHEVIVALSHLAISTLGALHLEVKTAHTAFRIGLFEAFSWPSELCNLPAGGADRHSAFAGP